MISLRIHHVGVYRDAQRFVQTAEHAFLGLTVSGCIRWQTLGLECSGRTGPYLSLMLAGDTTAFEYGPDRENWVIQFDTPDLAADPHRPERVLLRHGEARIALPRITLVDRPLVDGWVAEMVRIRECLAVPIPATQLRAELGVLAVLRFMLDSQVQAPSQSPAQMLRTRIDQDTMMTRSLDEHSHAVGYSPDYLRKLFIREYHVSPQQYRNRRRMASVMDLVANSRLSVKQIAEAAGFRHQSHLSAAFRSAFGTTPREAVRRFRYGG